ncbi:MAG TPA: hypothetical protein VKA05_05795 [Acidimicrobiales bacterium]|nr:hypothetical protein [Acidimicrobiales bacterium]
MHRRALAAAAALAALALSVTACGATQHKPSSTGGTQAPSTTRAPLPAGKNPSEISKMVCSPKAQQEIARILGVTAHVETPTWVGHLYSCRYDYPSGSFVLSVKELSSWSETYGYFDGLGTTLGDKGALANLGQGAFTTSDGSVIVRKDWKVLTVNIAPLPAQFGKPPTSKADVAFTVADIILGCWDGD